MSILNPRPAMKAALMLGALLGVGALDAATAAHAEGAWCAVAGGRNEYRNCGYYSFNQCRAAVSGVGGYCQPNPEYLPVRLVYPRY